MSLADLVNRTWRGARRTIAGLALGAAIATGAQANVPQARPIEQVVAENVRHASGTVPQFMLHNVTSHPGDIPDRFTLTQAEQQDAFERLYQAGYSTVSLKSYIGRSIEDELPEGRKACLLTTDDADNSVIAVQRDSIGKALYENGSPKLMPGTQYSTLKRFKEAHPEFGGKLVVYVDFSSKEKLASGLGAPFDDAEMAGHLLKLLALDPDIEIGYHTVSHRSCAKMSTAEIREDIERWDEEFTRLTGLDAKQYVRAAALPFGAQPSATGRWALRERFDAIHNAWGGNSPDPAKADLAGIPRIELHPGSRYGQPDTILAYAERNGRAFRVRKGAPTENRELKPAHRTPDGLLRFHDEITVTASAGPAQTTTVPRAEQMKPAPCPQCHDDDVIGRAAGGVAALAAAAGIGGALLYPRQDDGLATYVRQQYLSTRLSFKTIADSVKAHFDVSLTQQQISRIARKDEPATRKDLNELVAAQYAAVQYNRGVRLCQAGDARALQYARLAEDLSMDVGSFRKALTDHIDQHLTGQGTGIILERFDRTLLRDQGTYLSEAARLYESSTLTLTGIADELTAKYGMKVSATTVSRLAQEQLASEGRAVTSRAEAKATYRTAKQKDEKTQGYERKAPSSPSTMPRLEGGYFRQQRR